MIAKDKAGVVLFAQLDIDIVPLRRRTKSVHEPLRAFIAQHVDIQNTILIMPQEIEIQHAGNLIAAFRHEFAVVLAPKKKQFLAGEGDEPDSKVEILPTEDTRRFKDFGNPRRVVRSPGRGQDVPIRVPAGSLEGNTVIVTRHQKDTIPVGPLPRQGRNNVPHNIFTQQWPAQASSATMRKRIKFNL